MWKESIRRDSDLKTPKHLYTYFKERAEECDWCKGIGIARSVSPNIRKLINGYIVFDFLIWDGKFWTKYKMWQIFEDFVGEIMREALKNRTECVVVPVDKTIRGLDYVIANANSRDGWTVGIQCKKYIGSYVPKSRLEEYGSWTRGTSSADLLRKGRELHDRWGSRKRFVLIAFNAFQPKLSQRKRFNELAKYWDYVLVLDRCKKPNVPYTYRISCRGLDHIVAWC